MLAIRPLISGLLFLGILTGLLPLCAQAVPLSPDPQGFEGIPWGATFTESSEFALVEDTQHIKGYELKQGPLHLGGVQVDSMRFQTYNDKFVRVVIRYHSKSVHKQIVDYFQSQYGRLDHTPGQISKGPVQQYNWQGDESEIVLRYEEMKDRGIIFFESRAFALSFSEGMMAPDPDLGGATY